VSRRHLCDRVVADTPTLQTFVSCISGIFNTAKTWHKEQQPVYPAVSYWVVLEDDAGESDLAHRLMRLCPEAQVKRIKSLRAQQAGEWTDTDCGTLFIVLKDHSSGYVHQRIVRCLAAADCASNEPQRQNAQLFVAPLCKYVEQLRDSEEALKRAGLDIGLRMLGGNT